jgi:hypothetical protein
VQRDVADDAALADPALADLELRLHERDDRRVARERRDRGKDRPQRDEGEIGDDEVHVPDHVRIDLADIGSFEHAHPLILTQRPGELSAADVQRNDMRGAALQEAVRESAGGRPNVQAASTADVDRERIERRVELLATSRDEARSRTDELDRLGVVHHALGLRCDAARHQDVPGEHRLARSAS